MSKEINKSLPKKLRKGQIGINNQGLQMTIIEYRRYNDIDVQFEDGIIVRNKRYAHFLEGSIANSNYHYRLNCKNKRIGQTRINNQGLQMTIIEYKNARNIDVQFEDGIIVRNRMYGDFLIGKIVNPNECSDGISIPNKMLRQISFQLGLNLQFEYSPMWLENKRLDGYDDNLKIAIEMDGNFGNHEDKTIDNWKDEQCLKNGIYVIRINLMSTYEYNNNKFEYIKKQILNSPLSLIYNLSNINWELAWENSLKSLVWEVKRLIEEGCNNEQIAEILDISRGTIINYKKQLNIKTKDEIKQDNMLKTKELLEQGKLVKEIAKILDVCMETIISYKKELGIKTEVEIKKDNILKTKELLEQGKSNKEIKKILNISERTIKRYRSQLDIKIKTQKEIKQENIQKTKELLKQSKTNREIAEILNVSIETIRNYKREILNEILN